MNGFGEHLLAANALGNVIASLEETARETWRPVSDRESAVRALVMIRDGLPAVEVSQATVRAES